jgi:hypothetical protein
MPSGTRSLPADIAVSAFALTGAIALFSASLGFIRIVHRAPYPPALFWPGAYIGPIACLIAVIAAMKSPIGSRPWVLLAGTALYMSGYFVAETMGLARVPSVSLSLMLLYGVGIVVLGLRGVKWSRQAAAA